MKEKESIDAGKLFTTYKQVTKFSDARSGDLAMINDQLYRVSERFGSVVVEIPSIIPNLIGVHELNQIGPIVQSIFRKQ